MSVLRQKTKNFPTNTIVCSGKYPIMLFFVVITVVKVIPANEWWCIHSMICSTPICK